MGDQLAAGRPQLPVLLPHAAHREARGEAREHVVSGAMPGGGSGRRRWMVRSSVGAATKRPVAAKAAGAHASVMAATSGASSGRGAAVRSQPPVAGRPARRRGSAQRMS